MKYAAVLLMLFSTSACAEWTSADTKRQAIFTGVLALDWAQTRYIAKHPKYSADGCDECIEINTILGTSPTTGRVDGYFASAALIHYGVSRYGIQYIAPVVNRYFPSVTEGKLRAGWQYVSIGFEAGVVARNINLGIGFSF